MPFEYVDYVEPCDDHFNGAARAAAAAAESVAFQPYLLVRPGRSFSVGEGELLSTIYWKS